MERPPAPAARVLDAALACVARVGVAKTTLDDVAREAGCARATVYRCFPGRGALFGALLEREIEALGADLVAAAADADTLADAVVAIVLAGTRTFHTHAALGFVLAHEPELVAPQLSFERGSEVLRTSARLIAPALTRFVGPEPALRLGEWITRLTLSYLCNPSDHLQLDDPAQVHALVVDFVLPGVVRFTQPLAPANAGEGVST
jgi:AcrR family transcriptional regulator